MIIRKYWLIILFMIFSMQVFSQNCRDTVINSRTYKHAIFKGDCNGQKFTRYIERNLEYPKVAKKDQLTGIVIAQFIIDTNGHPSNIKIFQSLSSDYDNAVIEAILNSPNWIPAKINEKPVPQMVTFPVNFLRRGQKNQ